MNWISSIAKSTRWQYENGVADRTLLDPTTWTLDQVGLDRPGNAEIQLDLFYSYRTNVPLYPEFQAFFRQYQPPTLIVWGKNDFIFPPEGAAPYPRDLRDVETHLLDTGHLHSKRTGRKSRGGSKNSSSNTNWQFDSFLLGPRDRISNRSRPPENSNQKSL
jgi:hypothetical protein